MALFQNSFREDSHSEPSRLDGWYKQADAATPEFVVFRELAPPELGSFFHGHIGETSLSFADIRVLFDHRAATITAISPDGSIWRAVRGSEPFQSPTTDFAARYRMLKDVIERLDRKQSEPLVAHAFMLWLEKRGGHHLFFSCIGAKPAALRPVCGSDKESDG